MSKGSEKPRPVHSFFAKKSGKMPYQRRNDSPTSTEMRSPNCKESQSRNCPPIALKVYEGEPNLKQYLSSLHQSGMDDDLEQEKLRNRDMKRLKSSYMPKLFFQFESVFERDMEEGEEKNRQTVRLLKKYSHCHTEMADSLNSCLLVAQTIVWVKLSQQKFTRLFSQNSEMVVKILQVLNEESVGNAFDITNKLTAILFRLFCLPGLDCILWPSVLLQHVSGSLQLIKTITERCCQNTNSPFALSQIFQDTIHRYLANVMMHSKTQESFQPSTEEERLLREISRKVNRQLNCRQEFIVQLIGTDATLNEQEPPFEWNYFTYDELNLMIDKTPLDLFLPQINKIIIGLNEHGKMKNRMVKGREALFKLCRYIASGSEELCIPIRCTAKSPNNILIRRMKPQLNGEAQLKWVSNHELSVNQTLPKHNYEERKFYRLFCFNFTPRQILGYIYSGFLGKKTEKYITILRAIYPAIEIERKLKSEIRCQNCAYLVREGQQYACCKYCLIRYHACCIQTPKNQEARFAHTIYETENDEEVWSCELCSPCKACQHPIGDLPNNLKCKLCSAVYHHDCGKLTEMNRSYASKESFVCEACLGCFLCNASVKDQIYYIENERPLCSKCLCSLNEEHCYNCNERMNPDDFVLCSTLHCQTKSHKKCDPVLSFLKNQLKAQQFKCGVCRSGYRRKIILWVIEQLRIFDEYEYFDDPQYENIIDYFDVIKNPMCFSQMRSKALSGEYDLFAYQKIGKDLTLITSNAMTFNMPREQVHFKAKILLVAGQKYLGTMKEILEFNELQIMTKELNKIYFALKEAFYKDLYKHFPSYLLNYGKTSSRIEIVPFKESEQNINVFSSRHILLNGFKNAHIRYHYFIPPQTVQQLFQVPKLIRATWSRVSENLCYYHPKQRLPIIFQCKQCWETYCCTKTCYKHIFCCICRKYGCCCNQSQCCCPPLRQRQRKLIEKQIKPILEDNSITRFEYTEYHKYCLRCVRQKQRICYICHKLCYFGYEGCQLCKRVYHINCMVKVKMRRAIGCENKANYHQQFSFSHLKNICSICAKQDNQFDKNIAKNVNQLNRRLSRINSHLDIFEEVYQEHGLRLKQQEIIDLVMQNYAEYQMKLPYLNQYLNHRKNIKKNKKKKNIFKDVIHQFSQSLLFEPKIVNKEGKQQQSFDINQKIEEVLLNRSILYLVPEGRVKPKKGDWIIKDFNSKKDQVCSKEEGMKQLQFARQFYLIVMNSQCYDNKPFNSQRQQDYFSDAMKDLEIYLRFTYFNQTPTLQKRLIEGDFFYPHYDPFNGVVPRPNLYQFKADDGYLHDPQTQDQTMLKSYLTSFIIGTYTSSKIVLRKGNTYLIESNECNWKIYKKILGNNYTIRLFKRDVSDDQWNFVMNQDCFKVKSITDIINVFKLYGIRANTLEQVVAFLGFSFIDAVHSKALHFKNLLQRRDYYGWGRSKRKSELLRTYGDNEWMKDGIIVHKQNKRITQVKKSELFYLKKRVSKSPVEATEKEVCRPFINIEDLKKQIFPKQDELPGYFQQLPKMNSEPINDFYIAPSKIDRLGLFVGRDVSKNTTVIEYVGEIISESIADMRQINYKSGCYFFTIGENDQGNLEIIDATHFGNQARYLNHSCDPNCKARVVEKNGKKKIIFYTVRDVQKDEELTYDYQFKIESGNHLECKCGSNKCQGRLN